MKNRSKFIFLILAIVYCFLAIGKNLGFLLINENVLFGLSVTSLLITLGDVFGTIDDIFLWRNDYNYSLKVASDFLQERISKGCFTIRSFDVCNIKEGIDQLKSNNSPIHPLKYIKKRRHTILSFISTVFFVGSVRSWPRRYRQRRPPWDRPWAWTDRADTAARGRLSAADPPRRSRATRR